METIRIEKRQEISDRVLIEELVVIFDHQEKVAKRDRYYGDDAYAECKMKNVNLDFVPEDAKSEVIEVTEYNNENDFFKAQWLDQVEEAYYMLKRYEVVLEEFNKANDDFISLSVQKFFEKKDDAIAYANQLQFNYNLTNREQAKMYEQISIFDTLCEETIYTRR